MKVTFYSVSDPATPFEDDRNRGIAAVPILLAELERRGVTVSKIDPSTLSAEQMRDAYAKAAIPAIYKKYEVKRMFGTNRHSACWFGFQVPALLVKETDDAVGDTYPHRKSETIIVTIHDFLVDALSALASSRGSAANSARSTKTTN